MLSQITNRILIVILTNELMSYEVWRDSRSEAECLKIITDLFFNSYLIENIRYFHLNIFL